MYKILRGTKINVEILSSKEEVESFWKSIWCKKVAFNKDASWIRDFITNYCKDAKKMYIQSI